MSIKFRIIFFALLGLVAWGLLMTNAKAAPLIQNLNSGSSFTFELNSSNVSYQSRQAVEILNTGTPSVGRVMVGRGVVDIGDASPGNGASIEMWLEQTSAPFNICTIFHAGGPSPYGNSVMNENFDEVFGSVYFHDLDASVNQAGFGPCSGITFYDTDTNWELVVNVQSTDSRISMDATIGGALNDVYFWLDTDTLPPIPPEDDTTRIITLTPSDKQLVATSSLPFQGGATGYVSDLDFEEDDIFLEYYIRWQGLNVAVGPALALPQWQEREITSSGSFSFDDLFTLSDESQIGNYTFGTRIVRKNTFLGFTYWTSTLFSTTTSFKLSESSAYDLLVDGQTEEFLEQMGISQSSCSTDFSSLFNWDNIVGCVSALVVTGVQGVTDPAIAWVHDLVRRAPWGYATRIIEIWRDDSLIVNPATLSFSFAGTGLPVSGSFDFSPWEAMTDTLERVDEFQDPLNPERSMLDTFLFWWNTLWCIVFAFWLLREFYGLFGNTTFDLSNVSTLRRSASDNAEINRAIKKGAKRSPADNQFGSNPYHDKAKRMNWKGGYGKK